MRAQISAQKPWSNHAHSNALGCPILKSFSCLGRRLGSKVLQMFFFKLFLISTSIAAQEHATQIFWRYPKKKPSPQNRSNKKGKLKVAEPEKKCCRFRSTQLRRFLGYSMLKLYANGAPSRAWYQRRRCWRCLSQELERFPAGYGQMWFISSGNLNVTQSLHSDFCTLLPLSLDNL